MPESKDIKEVCKQVIDEASAILAYTESLEIVTDEKLKAIFLETRGDELSHLQKQVVALTEIMSGGEPEAAEQMDKKEGSGSV